MGDEILLLPCNKSCNFGWGFSKLQDCGLGATTTILKCLILDVTIDSAQPICSIWG